MTFYREDLAYVHDRGFGALAEAAASWLLIHLRGSAVPQHLILDLACGSGRLAAMLTGAGYRVWGIDASPAMIRLAKAAAPAAHFRVGSLYKSDWPPHATVITVVGEGLNYALPSGRRPNLVSFFRRAHKTLDPNGLLLFDVVTGPVSRLAGARGFACGADWAAGFETIHGRNRDVLIRNITTFRARRGGYRRSAESHKVYVYSAEWVTRILRDTGFAVRTFKRYNDHIAPRYRAVFAARKL